MDEKAAGRPAGGRAWGSWSKMAGERCGMLLEEGWEVPWRAAQEKQQHTEKPLREEPGNAMEHCTREAAAHPGGTLGGRPSNTAKRQQHTLEESQEEAENAPLNVVRERCVALGPRETGQVPRKNHAGREPLSRGGSQKLHWVVRQASVSGHGATTARGLHKGESHVGPPRQVAGAPAGMNRRAQPQVRQGQGGRGRGPRGGPHTTTARGTAGSC